MTTPSPTPPASLRFAANVLWKALALLLVFNLLFAWLYPLETLGRLSAYNRLFPGRQRLPYGDQPDKAYNLTLDNLEAMLAAHELAGRPPAADEYRVILIGDSSTWGWLLPAQQTLAAQINALNLETADGRRVQAYNLGYPVMSVTKDLLLLSYALRYQPDLVIWPVTLESLPYDKQLFSPLLQNNPEPVRALIAQYGLRLDPQSPEFNAPGFWQRTILGARRPLADLLRLQLYGVPWAATGIDQDIPAHYDPPQSDLSAELGFHGLTPPHLAPADLALDVLAAGVRMAGDTPLLLVNEPMFVSNGKNSDVRYNFYYPRWAYDDYRQIMQAQSQQNGWNYLDLWDLIPAAEFTNSAVHLSPQGTRLLAERLGAAIQQIAAEGSRP